MSETHPESSARETGEKKVGAGEGKNSFFEKHKALIIGGLGVLLVILYFVMRSGSSTGTTASSATPQSVAVPASGGDSSSGIDPSTGYEYGSPADIAALGGSGSVAATPVTAPVTTPAPASTTPAPASGSTTGVPLPAGNGPGGTYIPGYTPITFSMAQALAGKQGSSKLYYGTAHGVVQGKYANDKNVQYFVKSG